MRKDEISMFSVRGIRRSKDRRPQSRRSASVSSDLSTDKNKTRATTSNAATHAAIDLDWRPPWLALQKSRLPANLTRLRVRGAPVSDDSAFATLFALVEQYAQSNRGFAIDNVIEHLHETEVLSDAQDDSLPAQRLLIFALLGWQSMVYMPAFNTAPPSKLSVHHDAESPDSGLVFDTRCVSADLCDRPLSILLKGFGNLLPARARDAHLAAVESIRTAATWTALYPVELNTYLLHTLLDVRFRWVDTLALHLDYDKSSRTLCLFAFPSACAAQLRDRSGAIFAFGSTEGRDAPDPRGDEDDIAQLLKEVLLSFRLLFGQSSKSRRLFRHVFDPAKTPFAHPDTLLPYLCSEKTLEGDEAWIPRDRRIYYAARDFPVLYQRVELLAKELSRARPATVRDLLRDRRDTLQFWTFWLVAIIGGLSLALSAIQVVLAGIQISQGARS
ncbi:hypothetical protein B0T16DRAFT_462878 [Cercophora newfieldiana]|uniref:Uncharacterized protein n=1 Tax=Cercophora newfieldiana TaxID=92897 RepID=A0AA39XS16_9PEZI|nr:hypothetical protein B0T16DRAFT_462878 [Cercophora newfieldiana]